MAPRAGANRPGRPVAGAPRSFPASESGGTAPWFPVASRGLLPANPHHRRPETRGTALRDASPQAIRRASTEKDRFFPDHKSIRKPGPITGLGLQSGSPRQREGEYPVGILVRWGVQPLREHGQFFFQVRFEVFETGRNDLRRGEELALLRGQFRQMDLRTAVAKPRDAQRRSGIILDAIELTPLPWIGSEQLYKGQRFLEVLFQRGLISFSGYSPAGKTVHPTFIEE